MIANKPSKANTQKKITLEFPTRALQVNCNYNKPQESNISLSAGQEYTVFLVPNLLDYKPEYLPIWLTSYEWMPKVISYPL